MNKLFLTLIVLAMSSGRGIADEQIRRIQEELRKRHLYFGEIDGRKTEETIRALQHYQEKKGFKATGEPDRDTLGSLSLAEPPKDVAAWPDVPVLKSDAARQIKEEDRKYLESLPPVGEAPDGEDNPPTEQTVPPKRPPKPAREEIAPPRKETPPPPRKTPATNDTPPKETAPAEEKPAVPPERAEEFVRKYLDACETNQLESELAYYSDKVKYFDQGVVGRSFIERDVAAFYKRWPQRSYELLDFKVVREQGDEAVVKFRIAFHYRSPQHTVAGKTDNYFTIQRTGERLKFTSLKEQRLRD